MGDNLKKLDRVALVTGAALRIGKGIALDLAKQGWSVVVHYNSSEKHALELVSGIRASGGRADLICADLLSEKEIINLIDKASIPFGPVTCLINNASVFEEDTAMTQRLDIWDRHMKINLRAPFLLSQQLVSQIPSDKKGNIINIVDQRVWNLTPDFTSYTISKVGLWGATQILARAYAPVIRVNAVGPGPTLQNIHQSESEFRKEWEASPLQNPVLIEDICKAIRFILDAPAMTGQMIALDSGQHMGWLTERKQRI